MLCLALTAAAPDDAATPISVYGAWHCGNDACTWASVRDMTEFDAKNRWLVDRGVGASTYNVPVPMPPLRQQ